MVYRRERWDTPDGDFVDVDWIDGNGPLLVLFHGLEGSSSSHYAQTCMDGARRLGWRGAVVHFRGCSGEVNRLPRAYHSGDFQEIDWILRRFAAAFSDVPRFAVGVSLGGNALLKWCGECGYSAAAVLSGAVAISAPVDLRAAGDNLALGFNRLYTANFLLTLKRTAWRRLEMFPNLFNAALLRRAHTMREFDDIVTAPLHGFKNTDDYWTRAAAKPVLRNIRLPTLLINSQNDPFLPAIALPKRSDLSADITAYFPATGGHVGYVRGTPPGNLDWLPETVLGFFQSLR